MRAAASGPSAADGAHRLNGSGGHKSGVAARRSVSKDFGCTVL
ncbi:hypothetical protein [Wenjunlia tyrosinilytica]|nr:hypothetical protein [Wenjunlia tyrosinilytica]